MAQTESKTVLIVDDEETNRRAYAEMLELNNIKVLQAKDGQDALEIYQDKTATTDLVVLDIVMPRMNGLDALKAMREINPQCCCLVVTGYIDAEPLQEIINLGIGGILRKPFGMSELLGWVNKLLADGACKPIDP